MVFQPNSTYLSLCYSESLHKAAAKLHAARIRNSMVAATQNALGTASYFIAASGVAAILSHYHLVSSKLGIVGFIVTLMAIAFYVLATIIPTVVAKPTLGETAEHLDLAIYSHNQIATSYELSKTEPLSSFARQALADGLGVLERSKDSTPVVPAHTFHLPFYSKLFLVTGLLLLIATLTWPLLAENLSQLSASLRPSSENPLVQTLALETKPDVAKKLDSSQKGVMANLSQQQSLHSPLGQPVQQKNERSNSSLTAMASANQLSTSLASVAQSTPHSNSPNAVHGAQTLSDPKQSDPASNAASRVSSSSDSASPSANAGESVLGSPSGADGGDPAASPPGNSGSGSDNQSDTKSGDGQGGKGTGGKSQSKGSGSGDVPGEPISNGKGKGTGQNSLKKSRGVAPEYLGGLDPDTLTGPKLSGPDEQTREQISPVAGPVAPAPDAMAAHRNEPELPASHFDVPADSRSVVSDYFEALHGNAP